MFQPTKPASPKKEPPASGMSVLRLSFYLRSAAVASLYRRQAPTADATAKIRAIQWYNIPPPIPRLALSYTRFLP